MLEIETLAHEIINPLNIIVGCAELSKLENINNQKNKNHKQLSTYLDLILNQSKECCSILKEQIETYKEKDFNPYEIHQIIKENIKKHNENPILIQKKIKINFESIFDSNFDIEVIGKNINLTYLKIIINNLLLNAIKYSQNQTNISIVLKYDITKTSNNNYKNTCKNNYIIEIQNKIFDNNSRYSKNAKTSIYEKNNYLGLTLVDNLVKSINGEWDIIQHDEVVITTIYM